MKLSKKLTTLRGGFLFDSLIFLYLNNEDTFDILHAL
jgi:hypothetical protein